MMQTQPNTYYALEHVHIMSWIEAGDPVENVDMWASQIAADELFVGRLTSLYPGIEFELIHGDNPFNLDKYAGYSTPNREDIADVYQWVYDHADDWLIYQDA